jgi:hypothetical protein
MRNLLAPWLFNAPEAPRKSVEVAEAHDLGSSVGCPERGRNHSLAPIGITQASWVLLIAGIGAPPVYLHAVLGPD